MLSRNLNICGGYDPFFAHHLILGRNSNICERYNLFFAHHVILEHRPLTKGPKRNFCPGARNFSQCTCLLVPNSLPIIPFRWDIVHIGDIADMRSNILLTTSISFFAYVCSLLLLFFCVFSFFSGVTAMRSCCLSRCRFFFSSRM